MTLELNSTFVGECCKPLHLELDRRRTMNFAAATNDNNPAYIDDAAGRGIIAPPMLAVALTWKISEDFPRFWGDSGFPSEVLQRQVHYSEVIEWKRPMEAGEALRIEGEVRAILPHRAGTHLIIAYTAYDAKDEPVFVEYTGAMLRDVRCPGKGTGAGSVPEVKRISTRGEARWIHEEHIHPLAAHIYDGCADIHFPIHSSRAFAQAVGLPDTIYQGTATLALAMREIVNREAGGDAARLAMTACHFTGMVLLDTTIRVRCWRVGEGEGGTAIEFDVLNEAGERAVRNGHALVRH